MDIGSGACMCAASPIHSKREPENATEKGDQRLKDEIEDRLDKANGRKEVEIESNKRPLLIGRTLHLHT